MKSDKLSGEFAPYRESRWRTWQPTGRAGEVWVAIRGDSGTRVGRYDPDTFEFKQTNRFPQLRFDSMAMWADEAEGKLYAVENGRLLRLALTGDTGGTIRR